MEYKTIRQYAASEEIPEWLLRQRQKRGTLPGFFSGNRFYIDCKKLREMLAEESIANLRDQRSDTRDRE